MTGAERSQPGPFGPSRNQELPLSRSLELLRQIGEGGHSVVFLARRYGQHGFQRLVAVKVVRRDSELPSTVGDRFLHEARLLGLLQHRGIVVADDVVELDRGTASFTVFVAS